MAVVFKQKGTCLAFLPGVAGGKQGKKYRQLKIVYQVSTTNLHYQVQRQSLILKEEVICPQELMKDKHALTSP